MKRISWVALAAAAACSPRVETRPGHSLTLNVQLRAAKSPDALQGSSPLGSFHLILRSDAPQQSVTADAPFSVGQPQVKLDQPWNNLLPAGVARLTVWGVTIDGNNYSVGRSEPFALPADGGASASVFLGVANKWSAAPANPLLERVGGAAVGLGDGRILLVGGTANGAPVDAAVYDHAQGTVTPIEGGPRVVWPAAVALEKGAAMVAGGFAPLGPPDGGTSDGGAPALGPAQTEVWLFTGADGGGTFARQHDLPAAVGGAQAAYLSSLHEAFVIGGLAEGQPPRQAKDQVAAYTYASGALAPATSLRLTQARAFASASPLRDITGDLVLIAGGEAQENGSALSSAEVLSVQQGIAALSLPAASGAATDKLSKARIHHTAISLPGGRVLIYGGSDGATPYTDPSPEIFDPVVSNPGGFLPVSAPTLDHGGRMDATGAALPDGSALIVGGLAPGSANSPTILFKPRPEDSSASSVDGDYRALATGQERAGGAAVALPDGTVWVSGGSADGGDSTAVSAEIFVPCADADAPCSNTP